MNDTAYLSSEDNYIIFTFNDTRLKFIAPYSLQKYEKVITWDNGYIEVMTKYSHNKELEEEYIDLQPVLENLCMNPQEFLQPIKKVEVKYA